ncbi:MAG TPA: PqiC family protein, partial [Syntrophorhabdales bacterium]|nr:PqiC family protein [Syntrophorhabdales bacterium]
LLAGCAGSTPARNYVLSPLAEGKVASQESCPAVGIGPIKLPEYVNRTQIVTRTSPNEITLAYFDLWAEPLAESVPRTLAENVSRLICTKEIVFFPWRPSHVPDYRVEVEILTMDGALGTTVSLEAWWSVASGKARVTRKATYTEQVTGQGYDALVQAESRALAALSRDIAGALAQMK